MIKAIIFDCFGVVIADSLKNLIDQMDASNPELATDLRKSLYANHRGRLSNDEVHTRLAAGLGFSDTDYNAMLKKGEVKNQPLLDYIVALKGRYKTALLSNIGIGSIEKRFTKEELTKYFDTITLSGEVGFIKPEPEIYEITATKLGVRLDECVFTDDRETFCDGAKAVGMKAILFDNFDQFAVDLESFLKELTDD